MGLEEELFNQRQSTDGANSNIENMTRQIEDLRLQVNELQISEERMAEQIKEKEEVTFDLQGRIYNLEVKLQSKEVEKNDRITMLDNDWMCKFEGMCEEYEQRIELVEK